MRYHNLCEGVRTLKIAVRITMLVFFVLAGSASSILDSSGRPGQHYSNAGTLKGDVDGDGEVTTADALIYLKYSLGKDIKPYQISGVDDVTCDGLVNIEDALAVLKKAVDEKFNFDLFCGVDTTPPAVSSTDPSNNAVNISPKKTITVAFSETLRQGVNYNLISFKDAGNNPVSTTISITGNVLTIDPISDLEYNKTYIVTISSGAVNDLSNNTLMNTYTFSFVMLPTIQYQGPVGVFLDSIEAQNVRNSGSDFFAPYIFEILSHAGIPYAKVSRDEIAASAVNYPMLVLSHPTSFSVNETESIRRYVNDGGTLVAMGSTSGLDNILGVAPAAHYDEGFINVTVTDGTLLRAPLPLHVFSATPVTPVFAVSLARFLDRNYTDTGFAAVTSKSLGAGKAWYISADLALTVVKIQQGIPVVKDGVPAPDGSAPINDGSLKAEDGIVLNWTRDRTKLTDGSLFLEPVADHLKEMFLGVILGAYSREDARLPLLWYWPGDLNAVGALSHDTDWNNESLARVLLSKLTILGIESTWCFIEHPDQYSLQLFRDIAGARGETALHYDAQTGGNDTTWSEANFKSQLAWLENKTGLSVTTNKNHYTRWEGGVDFYRWLEAAGVEADQSKGSSRSGDSGFLFGTSSPYFLIDDAAHNNRFINVIAINLLMQDLDAKYLYSFGPQLIDKAVQHFGVGHFLFHPARIGDTSVADAMANLVNYGRSKGMEWWTIDHINKWERERRNIVFTNVDNSGFNIDSPLNVNGITMLVPMQNDTEPIEIVINGSTVTWRLWHLYGVPTARFTVNISAGLTHVDLRKKK